MPVPLDFRALEPADALDLAVLMEEEARQRYIEFAEVMDEVHRNHAAARFFRFMAANEEKHGQELWRRRQEVYANAPTRVNAGMLFDVEAPEYAAPGAFMSIRQCMQAALSAEEKAESFFRRALGHVKHPDVRALFEELAEEEVEHQKMVAEQLAEAPADEVISADDVADEPVGQD